MVYYSYRVINVTDSEVFETQIVSGKRTLGFGVMHPMKHASVSINLHVLEFGGLLEWEDKYGRKNSVKLDSGPMIEDNTENLDVHYNIDIVGANKIRFEYYYSDPNKPLGGK